MNDFHFSKEDYGTILSEFFQEIGIYLPTMHLDEKVKPLVEKHFQEKPWSTEIRDFAFKTVEWVARDFQLVYPHLNTENNVYISIHATYLFIIDDFVSELGDALDAFQDCLVHGKPQKHPVLQSFVDFLGTTSEIKGPQCCSSNICGALNFISASVIERDYDKTMEPPRGALEFPRFFRFANGYPETYAYFVFPEAMFPEKDFLHTYLPIISELGRTHTLGNDLVSLYKETGDKNAIEERLGYVWNISRVRNISVMEAARIVAAEVAQGIKNIRTVLADHPELLKAANSFINGVFVWHIVTERYRLSEIKILDQCGNNISKLFDEKLVVSNAPRNGCMQDIGTNRVSLRA